MNNIPYIEIYKQFCLTASNDDAIFSRFKSHPDYVPMLEHVNESQGREYLDVIESTAPSLLEKIEIFKTNDSIGQPQTYSYPKTGLVSPTTLRYIKHLADMINAFDDMNNEKIVEVGGGYGGQCKIISDIFQFKSYTIFDLPEVTGLINRYLKTLNVPNAKAVSLADLKDDTYDMFISNYAFTELDRELQQIFIDNLISKSTHGYITCNFISNDLKVNSYTKTELFDRIPHKYIVVSEVPQTHPNNLLLLW